MGALRHANSPHDPVADDRKGMRTLDSYGTVLVLIVLGYVAVSVLGQSEWSHLCIVVLLGLTLVFTLRTSGARLIWRVLAVSYVGASTLLTLIGVALPGVEVVTQWLPLVGGLLLLVTPFAIARRISAHRIVTTETVLGAICVYLLLGFSFAFIYSAIAVHGSAPFFVNHPQATINEYLFFSYTTLTTVGYGNLVPAGNVGQTFAMLEALMGQIYLVIVVARLVSLWGQSRPPAGPRRPSDTGVDFAPDDARPQAGTGIGADKDTVTHESSDEWPLPHT